MDIQVRQEPLLLDKIRSDLTIAQEVGGACYFEGIVRDHHNGKAVKSLDYECYESLTIKEMTKISEEARSKFKLDYVFAHHRIGHLEIGDTAVVIGCFSHHRAQAFDGCRYVIDQIKQRAAIWKKEYYQDGSCEWTRCSHG